MTNEDLLYQMHELGITTESFYANKRLSKEFKLLAVDYSSDVEFVTAIENKRYPIYGFTFHPEFFLMEFETYNKIKIQQNDKTAKIAKAFSTFINSQARQNSNRMNETHPIYAFNLDNVPTDFIPLVATVRTPSHGFMW